MTVILPAKKSATLHTPQAPPDGALLGSGSAADFHLGDKPGSNQMIDISRLSRGWRRQAGAGIWQLFCFDPNGARVELDFDANELVD